MLHRAFAAALSLLLLVEAAPARADTQSDVATAEGLFAEGRRLMAAGKREEACKRFAESQRLDPAPGTGLNLALCYEAIGKTASAWLTFRETEAAAARAGQKDRAALAKKKASLLEAKLSMLTVVVSPDAAVSGLAIRRDGVELAQGAWGAALPVDPGAHEIEATAPRTRKWSTQIQVAPGASKLTVTVPKLEEEAVVTPPPAPEAAVDKPSENPSTEPAPVDAPVSAERGKTQRLVGLSIGGLGLVTLGVGAYFGLKTNSTYKSALSACGGTTVCMTDEGLSLRSDADQYATISTVTVIAGAAMAAGGAILFFTAPKRGAASRVGLSVTPRGSGGVLSMQGLW